MTREGKLGYLYNPTPSVPGFTVPVFENNGEFFIQNVKDYVIISFDCVEFDENITLEEFEHHLIAFVGGEEVVSLCTYDLRNIAGTRNEVIKELKNSILMYKNPYVLLDLAEFIKDAAIIERAREAIEQLSRLVNPVSDLLADVSSLDAVDDRSSIEKPSEPATHERAIVGTGENKIVSKNVSIVSSNDAVATIKSAQGGRRSVKPTLMLVGADQSGVGKTTVARAVLDYLATNDIITRAFDTEYPRGTLHRFHPQETSIVDLTSASDQMRILDTLNTAQVKVSVVDVRAGGLLLAMQALEDTGFLDAVAAGEFDFLIHHVLGPSIASLEEIEEIAPYVQDAQYFLVKNHVNDTTFFEWDPVTHRKYFEKVETAGEITIPKLNEMAYEQVEIAGTPFTTFVGDRTAEGAQAGHSFVLRGYVRTWLSKIAGEFSRVGLLDLLTQRSAAATGKSA